MQKLFQKNLDRMPRSFLKGFLFFNFFSSFSFRNISTDKFQAQREGLNSWFKL